MKRLVSFAFALCAIICISGCGADKKEAESEELIIEEPVLQDDGATVGERNALESAMSYLSFSAFSPNGLVDQLKYEGYTQNEAVYAVNHCGADWNEQAVRSAKNYLSISAFSYRGLTEQLLYEGFVSAQANYGVENCGADWNEQAAKSAQNYLNIMDFSREDLIEQLKYEGFTAEQAEYGVNAVY